MQGCLTVRKALQVSPSVGVFTDIKRECLSNFLPAGLPVKQAGWGASLSHFIYYKFPTS